ncbi:MAG: methyltransferase domain-containing protein [Acidobacteriota bacterium]
MGFGDFAEGAGRALLGILETRGLRDGLVYDLGCGDGRWARRLVEAGYDVVGADLSAAMIRRAREAVAEGDFRLASLWEIALDACQAVTILGEGLGYAAAGDPSETRLKGFFQRLFDKLQPAGLLAFDVIVAGPDHPMQYRDWRAGDDWAILTEVNEDPARHRLTRSMTIFRRIGESYRRSQERHAVSVLEEEKLVRLLEETGFEVEVASRYGDFDLAPRRRAFLATKS